RAAIVTPDIKLFPNCCQQIMISPDRRFSRGKRPPQDRMLLKERNFGQSFLRHFFSPCGNAFFSGLLGIGLYDIKTGKSGKAASQRTEDARRSLSFIENVTGENLVKP